MRHSFCYTARVTTPVPITPIGIFRGAATYKYDAPRQGVLAGGSGTIELAAGRNFETALRDLDGFDRIWVIFLFDRNGNGWRPTTRPPVAVPVSMATHGRSWRHNFFRGRGELVGGATMGRFV